MTNMETLMRNACKAAGIEYSHAGGYRVIGIGETGMKVMEKFNPADDDGDSRVLQVACKIGLHFIDDIVEHARATAVNDRSGVYMYVSAEEPLNDDDRKATRMAVLRCAWMIGEAME